MLKLRYPSWSHWHAEIESALATAVEKVNLTGSRVNTAATKLHVPVKSPDQNLGSMPFIQTALTGMEEGWDDEGSGVEDFEGVQFIDIGGTKSIKQTNFYRERLTWTIEILGQRYLDVIEIAQSIRKHFGPRNTFYVMWQDDRFDVDCRLSDFDLMPAETGRDGHVEFFLASWQLKLSIKSDLSADDEVVENIEEVVTEITASDGTNDSDELIKTIT